MVCRWTVVAVLSFLVVAVSAHEDTHLRASGAKGSGHVVLQSEGTSLSKTSAGVGTSETVQLSRMTRLKMTMHKLLRPLSAAAVITTVALQLSPLPSSMEIKRDQDVKRYDGYPYFSVLAGATQWCLYGSFTSHMTGDRNVLTMVAANSPGVFFGLFYITNFFRFVPAGDVRDSALKRYLSIGAVIMLAELVSCVMLGHGAIFWLGLLGAVGSAQIALSPFKTLPEVMRTSSTRSWPLDLCVWNLIQSLATGGFGLSNDDVWVWAPNLIGVIAAVIQLTLIALFWERKGGPRGTCVKLKASAAC